MTMLNYLLKQQELMAQEIEKKMNYWSELQMSKKIEDANQIAAEINDDREYQTKLFHKISRLKSQERQPDTFHGGW